MTISFVVEKTFCVDPKISSYPKYILSFWTKTKNPCLAAAHWCTSTNYMMCHPCDLPSLLACLMIFTLWISVLNNLLLSAAIPQHFCNFDKNKLSKEFDLFFLNLKHFKSPRYKDLQYTLFKKSWFSKEKKPGFIGISSFSINPKRSSYITFQHHSPPMKYQKIS